ncbi:RrF2 family transcriptional regulator [Enterovibrio paralichthyis]|uniref:RrF2 family transcriptional regulator n=1 Tax=Enterovibrio paralichthyis TaxID=2853805 RepID=UPI001C4961BF|nr:Rrf2 family transcriptional regulator [Enterovibrio paralichthyis]MBV7296705.1 Rrf2 family transcriptional regulator [Enterovibrio paralichthyis]
MKINIFTNLTFRALIYLALNENRTVKTSDIAEAYNISYNHLKKVMYALSENGYVISAKGRSGGFRLSRPKEAINVGEVFRTTVEDVAIAECFASPTDTCVISPDCRFRHILQDAASKFIGELDNYSLADLVRGREGALSHHLNIEILSV